MITFLTTLLLVLSVPTIIYSDEPDKTLHNKCLYPSVLVKANNGFGSGVIVRSDRVSEDRYQNVVITCAHCLPSPHIKYSIGIAEYKDWSYFEKWNYHPAFVYFRSSEKDDIAILLFESDKPVPTAKIDFNPKIYIGTDVLRVGCGMGDEQRIDFGKITSLNGRIEGYVEKALRTSVYSVPGDSGGPLYHENKVIGITQALRSRSVNHFTDDLIYGISYAIPMRRLKKLSKEINSSMDFVYESKDKLPVIPFFQLRMGDAEFNQEIMPGNRWSKGF